jgi:hypothetical protein
MLPQSRPQTRSSQGQSSGRSAPSEATSMAVRPNSPLPRAGCLSLSPGEPQSPAARHCRHGPRGQRGTPLLSPRCPAAALPAPCCPRASTAARARACPTRPSAAPPLPRAARGSTRGTEEVRGRATWPAPRTARGKAHSPGSRPLRALCHPDQSGRDCEVVRTRNGKPIRNTIRRALVLCLGEFGA